MDVASLQLLFPVPITLPAEHLLAVLRAYHTDFASVSVEFHTAAEPPAKEIGTVVWNDHSVRIAVFDTPMPANAIDGILLSALLPEEIKHDARNHQAHVLLYETSSADGFEKRVALAAVAGALAEFGAIVTLNEEARTAILSTDLLPDQPGEDMMQVLRTLPIPYLYGGFVKLVLSDTAGVWMRTFACHTLGLPDLAHHATHEEGQATFQLFSAVLGYLKETGVPLLDGETLRIDDANFFTVRQPREEEWWLDSSGDVWVLQRA